MNTIFNKIPLLKSFSTYTLFNLLNAGIPFLLLPVLTHYLSPKDYGTLSNINSLLLFIVPFVGINISAAVTRQFVKKEIDLPQYIGNALLLTIISFVIVQIILFISSEAIENLTKIPKEYVVFIAIYAMFHNVIELLLAILRMKNETFNFGIFKIIRTVIEISLSLIFVIIWRYNWEGRFWAIFITISFFGIIALVALFKMNLIKFKFHKKYTKHFLKFGSPLILHSLSGVLILYSDKIIITNMIGIEENGIYSVAFQIGMVISLFQNSFNQAWVPWLYKKLTLDNYNDKLKIVKITYIYFILILLLVGMLWLITPLIFSFIGAEFSAGSNIVFIIGLGFAFNGMYKMVVNYIFFIEKTYLISIVTITVALLNIYLNFVFINKYGLIGAGYASSLSFFIEFIVIWWLSSYLYKMPWNLKIIKD